ncbi:hypothetical protein [Mycobacterium sp. 236(2023)]|uniref:hypothetical protein n=1 Tax=Mycobacterium sp. 236(2023) TaxID=3038163 RepID=UPI0024157A83|nr:hypothetical protein [Mycobacterium sp. 236(2023)]MDG4667416.1 hypothetical protein [Mycobacterium sp. 236(2023)]
MADKPLLRGTDLRYVIVDHLFRHGPKTIPDIIEDLRYHGFEIAGRPSKSISDALRWEVRRGRLRHLRRGRYGPADMPRSTEQRIHTRAMTLRARAGLAMGRDGDHFWDRLAAYL